MKKEEYTYETAMKRLETLVTSFEQGDIDIDDLSNRLKEAQELLKFCKARLLKAEKDVKKIIENE